MKFPKFWEVAVILAILAGLAFLFWPIGVGGSKGYAKKTMCLSNLKRLSVSTIIYAADYNELLPNRDTWLDDIYPYIKTQDKLICPIVNQERNPQLYGYAFNGRLSSAKSPAKPEAVPLIFESINLAKNASGDLDSLPSPGRHPHYTSKNGANNIGYADGHAKSVPVP